MSRRGRRPGTPGGEGPADRRRSQASRPAKPAEGTPSPERDESTPPVKGDPPLPQGVEKFLNLLADVIAEEVIRDHRAAQKSTEVAAPLQKPLMSRLLDLPRAAAYLGISPWTLRELPLPRVRLEPPSGKALRKILYDRQDLDAWIDRHKDLPMDR